MIFRRMGIEPMFPNFKVRRHNPLTIFYLTKMFCDICFTTLFTVSWQLTLFVLCVAPPAAWVMGAVSKKLKSQYAAAQNKVQARAAKVEQDIQEYLVKAAGADKQMSAEDIAKRSAMLHEDGDLHLVDPLDLKNVIEKLSSDIETFRQECDATMTEQNALTKVNIDLTNID